MTIRDERRRLEQTDAVVELFDLDYGMLVGAPGDPQFVAHFTSYTQPDVPEVRFGGVLYGKLPIRVRGSSSSTEGAPARPRIEVGNGDGRVSAIVDSIGGDLKGARLCVRRIYSRHLDGGEDPDPRQEWRREVWRVERKTAHNRHMMEYELTVPQDVEGLQIPSRIGEATMCTWTYKDPDTCGWIPGAGPYFDAKGNETDIDHDNCGLGYDDCRLRFKARNEALRFGGFPSLGRIYR